MLRIPGTLRPFPSADTVLSLLHLEPPSPSSQKRRLFRRPPWRGLDPFVSGVGPGPWACSLLVLIAWGASAFLAHGRRVFTEKDTVVLADFANSTGDPVFDGTLRQGLEVQLEQSPFLSLISDQRIQQVLHLMGQPANARLDPEMPGRFVNEHRARPF